MSDNDSSGTVHFLLLVLPVTVTVLVGIARLVQVLCYCSSVSYLQVAYFSPFLLPKELNTL